MRILKVKNSEDIKYTYVSSIDKNDYAICIHKIQWGNTLRLVCDYYDYDWVFDEIVYMWEWDWIDIIPAYEIEDCPTLKWFYIPRK